MSDFKKIHEDYDKKFNESIPIFYADTDEKYIQLMEEAEKAIKRGKKLTLKEVFNSMGMEYNKGDKY